MKRRFKKRYLFLLVFTALIAVSMFFLSTFLQYYLIKNSEKMIGRKIDVKEIHINYLKCSIDLKEFVLYEKSRTDTFVAFKELLIDYDPLNLFSHEYAFSEIKLMEPTVNIGYDGKTFNFDDLTKLGDSTKKDTVQKNADGSVRYVLKNVHLESGRVKYHDELNHSNLDMKDLGINLPLISWDSRQADMGLAFKLGESGEVIIGADVNQTARTYKLNIKTNDIDLAPLKNYFVNYSKDYCLISDVAGKFFSDVNIIGDMNHPTNLVVSGQTSIKNCVIKDVNKKPFLLADNASVVFDTLDMGKFSFKIAKVVLTGPQLAVVLEKDKSNLEKIFSPIMAPKKMVAAAPDTSSLFYQVKNFMIINGKISFADLTLERPFYYDLNKMNITMQNINPKATDIPLDFDVNLNNSGTFKGTYKLNMLNPKDLVFDGKISNMSLISFSPYTEHFLARPITKGIFNYHCKLKMNPDKLDNLNLIRVDKMEFGKKNGKPLVKAPVNLALYILKDKNDVINIELPVDGKPSDPNFKLSKIIWTTLENFLVKIALSPFKAIGSLFSTNPEDIKDIPFVFMQDSLDAKQQKTLDLLAEVHQKKPDFVYNFTQKSDVVKEKEGLAVYEAKSRFIKQNVADTINPLAAKIKALSDKDTAFLVFIKANADSLSLPKHCLNFLGNPTVDLLFQGLLAKREKLIADYLHLKKNIPMECLVVKTADLRDLTEELKQPKFDVELSLK